MAITHDLIAKAGEYTSKEGETKIRWHKCGVAMDTKNGGVALNIESLPVNFDGWLQMRTPLPKDGAPRKSGNSNIADDLESDIPF